MSHKNKKCTNCYYKRTSENEFPCCDCSINFNNSNRKDHCINLWHPEEPAEKPCDFISVKPEETPAEKPGRNVYRDNIVAMLDKQREKGLKKYGETLEDNVTLTREQRIEHLEEEMIDALQYAEHLKLTLNDGLTANDFQRAAMRTASGMNHDTVGGNGLLLNGVMGLNGEAGECIDIVKKHIFQGHELDLEHLIEELGDASWYLAICCEAAGVTFGEVLQRNIDKLKKRYPEGFDKARSINREEESKA